MRLNFNATNWRLWFGLSILGLIIGCAKETTIKIPELPDRLVVVSHFAANQPFRVKLTISNQAYEDKNPIIPAGAELFLSKNGQYIDKLKKVTTAQDGTFWITNNDSAFLASKYSLRVKAPGYPDVETFSEIPTHVPLKPIRINKNEITELDLDDGRKQLRIPIALELNNLPSTDRFFGFNLTHDTDVIDFIDGEPFVDFTIENQVTNFTADGRTLSLLHNIAEPVVMVNEKYWAENVKTLYLNAVITFNPSNQEVPKRIYVEWRTLSKDFYKYHLSIARQGNNLPLSEPDAIYNNIKGGYGNFSGYDLSRDTLVLD